MKRTHKLHVDFERNIGGELRTRGVVELLDLRACRVEKGELELRPKYAQPRQERRKRTKDSLGSKRTLQIVEGDALDFLVLVLAAEDDQKKLRVLLRSLVGAACRLLQQRAKIIVRVGSGDDGWLGIKHSDTWRPQTQ